MLEWNGHKIPTVAFEVGNDPEHDSKTIALPCHCQCDWLHVFYKPSDLEDDYAFDKRMNNLAFIGMFPNARPCAGHTMLANSPTYGLEACMESFALQQSPLYSLLGPGVLGHLGLSNSEPAESSGDQFPKEVKDMLEKLGIKTVFGERKRRGGRSIFDRS